MKKTLFLAILFLLTACQQTQTAVSPYPVPGGEQFTIFANVSRNAGISNTRQGNGRTIGQAWGDYDRDGWLDFYVTDMEGPNSLYHNNGDGTFTISPYAETVAQLDGYSGGATFADYDNDGWPDLYVVNWGANALYHNDAGRGFTDVTALAGVGDEANGQTASWGDYDNDGNLDLYVANWSCYPRCGRPSQGDSDRLFHNNGDGTFSDATRQLGGDVYGAAFVASFTDYDNDGDLDIYLINDEFLFPTGNKLWRNDGPGCGGDGTDHCFTEVSVAAQANTHVMGMGLATTDYDNDGDFDFYFTNVGPMTLLQNQGDGTFDNVAAQAGVEVADGVAWGTAPLDYNNDGWQDLYLTVMTTADHTGIAANRLFHNNGDGTFRRVSGSGAADVGPTMGVATADFDNDGWVDLLIGNKDNGYSILRNQMGGRSENRWLTLKLVGGGAVNRDAVGARVMVQLADDTMQTQEVRNGGSLGAGSELALHFGTGTAAAIPELTVVWPDGRSQQFNNIATNQAIILPYPSDANAEAAQMDALYAAQRDGKTAVSTPSLVNSLLITAVIFLIVALIAAMRVVHWPRWGLGLAAAMVVLSIGMIWAQQNLITADSHLAFPPLPQRLPSPPPEQVALGEALFWDPLLGGNEDTACVTCHHPLLGTGDGLSLPIGTGGQGLAPAREFGSERHVLVPRNATPIFNLALAGMDTLFWDGRVQGNAAIEYASPANDDLPFGLENAVAVQAMFPVISRDEMRGQWGDFTLSKERNGLASISDHQPVIMWDELIAQILAVPAYQPLFAAAYPDVPLDALGFEQAANALAAYQMETFTFLDSPWDRYLAGDKAALSADALAGAALFYGEAGCASCHSGALMSDLGFHNIGVPQIGPGKEPEAPYDYGRARVTGDDSDLFAFRTPPLRDVALTGPWMHNGAYLTLEETVRHHLNPAIAVAAYDYGQLSPVLLEADSGKTAVHTAAISAPSFTVPTTAGLSDSDVAALLAFLEALTSPSAMDLTHTIPDTVPSGLPVGGTITNN